MKGVLKFAAVLTATLVGSVVEAAGPPLEWVRWEPNGWPRLSFSEPTNAVYSIQSSGTLNNWTTLAVLHGREVITNAPALSFIDPSASRGQTRFYRLRIDPLAFENDWRNQVYYPDDEFRNEAVGFGLPETRWIKFAITTNESTRVYFQNSWKYKFHYNFAFARLPGFAGLTPIQFDEVSLHTNSQRIVLGAVLFSPRSEDREVGIQFVGQDPYPPEKVVEWFEIVRSTLQPLGGLNVVYIPTYEQMGVAEANREFFAGRGVTLGSLTDWDTGANAYSMGWAMGTLKFIPAGQISQAYASGTLKPTDILLTDGIPAELPYLAGILTLTPSTPNSHVAILARSYGVPFAYLSEPELRALAQNLAGREVVFTAFAGYPQVSIRLFDVSEVDPPLRQEIASRKQPAPLAITPKARYGAYTAPTDALAPHDIQFFGGKAANFGFLRRQVPTNSPAAIAISFDLWDDFMSQTNAAGKSLREQIAARLNKYSYPPNIAALSDELETIRDLIEDSTLFTTEQQQLIATALLARFEPQTRIRFRSSTNVEDAENFTGAGLYDSYSGCLADDQDADTAGPSICDPTEKKERGVFRAIRKAYASFYNDNAFLERLRHRIDESKVGMALLVHYSSPDESELANGVATITYTKAGGSTSYEGKLVTQKGAVSVTNPDGSAVPEVVQLSKFGGTPYASVQQWSSLVPFGANVLSWDAEYKTFGNLFEKTARAFETYYPNKQRYTLDFEYKKLEPGILHVKQVREIPTPDPNVKTPAYLLNEPQEWWIFQGEYGSVFANHRLKSKFQFTTRNLQLAAGALNETLYGPISLDYVDDGAIHVLRGVPSSFSNATHRVGPTDFLGTALLDSWTMGRSNGPRQMTLTTTLRTNASSSESPLLTLADARIELSAKYPNPVPVIDFGPLTNSVTEESVVLTRRPLTNAQSIEVTRTVPLEGGAITIRFYWPQPPQGASAGYTAPLVAWKETQIEGLTTQPIVLRDYYSQTYRPEHHNFSENFIFEPAMEPGLAPAILNELAAKNIRYIYVYWGGADQSTVHVSGPDGNFRPLLAKPPR